MQVGTLRARSRSTAIASNSGRSSSAVLARSWFAIASRDFRSVSVRRPCGRAGRASEIFEIYVDKPKCISAALGRHSPETGTL